MLDLATARQLKDEGLEWQPTRRDHFVVPVPGLTEEIFTLNDQTVFVQTIKDQVMVTFHGAAEWALDEVLVSDVVWLPTEAQLRSAVEQRITGNDVHLTLVWDRTSYTCLITRDQQQHAFVAASAEGAYAAALLFLLRQERAWSNSRWVTSA